MSLVGQIAELQNYATYKELSWEGSFEEYLQLVRRTPHVTQIDFARRSRSSRSSRRSGAVGG